MKIVGILLVLFCWLGSFSYSQYFGNEWINYNQKYYTFKISSSGIHKLDYTALSSAGVPLSNFSSANIQLFGREQEIPLFIEDGGDGQLGAGDYILFYAEKNDGWLDTTLYDSPTDLGNPKYSLYNDTIQYFFTWNNSTNNLRFTNETDISFATYVPSNFILFEKFQSFSTAYNEGEKTSDASSAFYTSGEGWGNTAVNGAAGYTWDYSSTLIDQVYQGSDAPPVEYNAVSVGVSNANFSGSGNHHTRHTIGTSNYVIADSIFTGYKAIHIKKFFPASVLPSSGNSNFKVSIVPDQGANTDYQSINYWSFIYPRTPNLGGLNKTTFKVQNNIIQPKIRLDLTNIPANNPVLFVLGDVPRKITLAVNGTAQSMVIPNSQNGLTQTVIYQDMSTVTSIVEVTAVNGNGLFTNFSNASAYNPEEALLMVYHPSMQSAAVAYAEYRSTDPHGGNYNVILANVNELYQQYGGGIPKHINGIRRFAHHIYSLATVKPVGLFLMGKGIREANVSGVSSTGAGTRTNVGAYASSFIPSFGQPSSDALITSNLPGTTKWVPLIPTGRVAVKTNQELADYLDKVKSYDLNQDQASVYNSSSKDWQKHVLHFTGGTDANQQLNFQGYMSLMKNIIENQYFGGSVKTLSKTADQPLNPSELNSIMERIQEGVSLITFFGHSAPTTTGFEINIDEPSNWNNYGKYPIIIANSCYNGNIFQNGESKSESFVNVPEAGAIAYIGSVNLGFANALFQYSSTLYQHFSNLSYGRTLGEQIKSTIQQIEPFGVSLVIESTCTQMALNGDPMVRINWHEKPEIELLQQNITFSPQDLNLTVDSIDIQIELTNLGKSIIDTFLVEVSRDFPGSNADSVYIFNLPNLHYKDTISFKVPLQSNIGVGINNFTVRADLPTFIDEIYDEVNNNEVTKTLFIDVDGIQPVIPYEFAVVPLDSITLKASTINPIASFNTYRFEIDTSNQFNSPFKKYALISGTGGVKEVHPSQWLSSSTNAPSPLVCTDSMVYFWRVAINEANPTWRESSFQYIPTKTGWGQDHFFQFKNNSFSGIQFDAVNQTRNFFPFSRDLACNVYYAPTEPTIYNNLYTVDGQMADYGIINFTPKFHVAVLDRYTLEPWGTRFVNPDGSVSNPTHNFGNANDNFYRVWKYFTFNQNDVNQLNAFQNMIQNSVPDSSYILIYSPMTTLYDQINSLMPSVFTMFQTLGSDSILPTRPNLPFAFLCRKGDPNSVIEYCAQFAGENVFLEATLTGIQDIGQEGSPLIGPAANWDAVYWKQDPLDLPNSDSTHLFIRGYDLAGNLNAIFDTLFTANDSLINLNNFINATTSPFIQLNAFYTDTIHQTPAQIDRWHVLFTPLPEAAIDGSNGYTWLPNSDTLTEGQNVQFAVDVKNIFTLPMDSLLITYWVSDQNAIKHPITYARQDSLLVGETFRDTITFSTIGLGGSNSFWMEVNPYVNGSLYETDQPEQQHFNNLLQIPFYVNTDNVHPILDVTFNGRHILNGDIVSPESEILISLKDDNPYLIMNDISDTALFGIYLTDPNGIQTRIPFIDGSGNAVMQWIPAENQFKRFKIIYPAVFAKDGKYTLMVQGSDRSGNLSGDFEYRISFEVIHESMITHLMNYPNPFSTSTRFVFTLTGSEIPDEMIIQIMTVSGKVVREITEDQFGSIQIGRNISEYVWDGTDEYGDPLANGGYLYRVKMKLNGEDIKHLESGADQYFEKDFGKMYILR